MRFLLSAALAALAVVSAQSNTTTSTTGPVISAVNPIGSSGISSGQNDLNTLEYALTAEQLEAAFYAYGISKFSQSAFAAAGYNASVYNNLQLIASEEATHAATLNATIAMLGGNPVKPCTYNFTAVTSVPTFLAYASVFEAVGVNAYDGALNAITSPTYQQIAAQIAVIEGKHASYVNYIQGLIPFPFVFDNATTPNVTWPLLAPFFSSCPSPAAATAAWPLPNGVPGISLPVPRTLTTNFSAPASITANELATINYALTYENFEMTFYKTNYAKFSVNDFIAAGYTATDYEWVGQIVRNEETHVIVLQTLGLLFGNAAPLPVCSYNYPQVNNVTAFLALGALFCNTGGSAVVGAAPTVVTPALQQAFASVATVEGRHTAYLDTLVGNDPVYSTFQKAYNASTAVSFLMQYNISCPYPLAAPTGIIATDAFSTPPAQSTITNTSTPNNALKARLARLL